MDCDSSKQMNSNSILQSRWFVCDCCKFFCRTRKGLKLHKLKEGHLTLQQQQEEEQGSSMTSRENLTVKIFPMGGLVNSHPTSTFSDGQSSSSKAASTTNSSEEQDKNPSSTKTKTSIRTQDNNSSETGKRPRTTNASSDTSRSSKDYLTLRYNNGFFYECNFCKKVTKGYSNARLHVRSHTGEKPYRCHFCGKAVAHKPNLTSHIRMHTGEKPYPCDHPNCGQSVGRLDRLKNHKQVHTV